MSDKVNVSAEENKIIGSMAEIAATNDVEYAEIPGFKEGQTLRIGSLTAGDLIEWSESNTDAKRTAGLRLITKSLVGPEPENVRYADDAKNIKVFSQKSHKATENIVKAILKLNGMQVKAESEAKNE